MNFLKFQCVVGIAVVSLLLNGCVIAPKDEGSDSFSRMSSSDISQQIGDYNATANAGYHIVQRGETLYGISRRYGFNYHDVAVWNNIYPPYTIWPGQQLLIYTVPVVNSLSVSNQYPNIVPANYTAGISPLSYRSSAVVPLNYTSSYVMPLNYRTSTTMPVYYNTPAVVPVNYAPVNYADDSYTYTQGKSALSVVPVTTVVPNYIPASNFHTVRAGENLASIAALYGLTTYDLALWNGITSPYTVYVGQQLLIVAP